MTAVARPARRGVVVAAADLLGVDRLLVVGDRLGELLVLLSVWWQTPHCSPALTFHSLVAARRGVVAEVRVALLAGDLVVDGVRRPQ